MPDTEWGWYASADEEAYGCGPEATREAIIAAATADDIGFYHDESTGIVSQSFHIIEARKNDVLLAEEFSASTWLQGVNEQLEEFTNEDGADIVSLTPSQTASLQATVREALHKWQAEHGLRFQPWVFAETRGEEQITLPETTMEALRAAAQAANGLGGSL
jgi:hypothetical protein